MSLVVFEIFADYKGVYNLSGLGPPRGCSSSQICLLDHAIF